MIDEEEIFIVDDDDAVRDSLSILLRATGYRVRTFSNAGEFLESCTHDWYGCVILDVMMPVMDGPSLRNEMLQRGLESPVIFLTAHGSVPLAVNLVKAGAFDFLVKPIEGPALVSRVQDALKIARRRREEAEEKATTSACMATLTVREREIMTYMLSGYTSREIGDRLCISRRTVEIHRSHIMNKTGAASLLELARIADAER